jgi:hypothetical protein
LTIVIRVVFTGDSGGRIRFWDWFTEHVSIVFRENFQEEAIVRFLLPFALVLCLMAPAFAADPPSSRRQAEIAKMLAKKKAKSARRAVTRAYEAKQNAAAEKYYVEKVLPQQLKQQTTQARLTMEAQRSQALHNIGQAALQDAQTNQDRLRLQRQVAGYPLPGVNPYTGVPFPTGVAQTPITTPAMLAP